MTYISVLVFNLQEPITVVKDGKPLQLMRGMIKNSTDKDANNNL